MSQAFIGPLCLTYRDFCLQVFSRSACHAKKKKGRGQRAIRGHTVSYFFLQATQRHRIVLAGYFSVPCVFGTLPEQAKKACWNDVFPLFIAAVCELKKGNNAIY
nr:hypothetical protein [Pandoravirus massiliensis]